MGWEDLRRPDGLEMDQFDHDEATHHLVIRACCRPRARISSPRC
jgi:N-acyl-L-homoserine lactone synthetase